MDSHRLKDVSCGQYDILQECITWRVNIMTIIIYFSSKHVVLNTYAIYDFPFMYILFHKSIALM